VTSEPRAFLSIDRGTATVSVALIGRIAGRWRLVGRVALPAGVGEEVAGRVLIERVVAADPDVAAMLVLDPAAIAEIPAIAVRSRPPGRLAVVAASDRALGPLIATAARSGWRTAGASPESTDPLAMARLLLESDVAAILAGAGDPPGADERGALDEVAALVASVATRRPDLPVVLAGAMADGLPHFGDLEGRTGEVLLGPPASAGIAAAPLRALLLELSAGHDDSRRALGRAAASLADVLDRRLEVVDIGHDAGTRIVVEPGAGGSGSSVEISVVPDAALVPLEPDDAIVDGVLGWSTIPSDRHRLRDRLRELRLAPWADAVGEGAHVRTAAARAAMRRLVDATPDLDERPAPDLVVVGGGVWAVVPPAVATLAVADILRRPGASQFVLDHARLLASLGVIEEEAERRAVVRDLVDDLLVPLGSVVTPVGLRAGRGAGEVTVHGPTGSHEMEMWPGEIERFDLAPGETAVVELNFRDTVRLGTRGRHFAVDLAGGLAGILLDLRDVPLRLPDRSERRREQLATWQGVMWPEADA
jgi:hypothetical protein